MNSFSGGLLQQLIPQIQSRFGPLTFRLNMNNRRWLKRLRDQI